MERRSFLKVAATSAAATLASAYANPAALHVNADDGNAQLPTATQAKSHARARLAHAPLLQRRFADLALWQARWEGMQAAIQATHDSVPKELPLFRALLINLGGFAEQQVGYFLRRLQSNAEADRPPEYYSHEAALNMTLNQIGFDLNAIAQAAQQRQVAAFKTTLEKADVLAELSLQPAINAGLFQARSDQPATRQDPREPKPILLTYFQRSPMMRVIPYAPIALIGLPYTSGLLGTQDNVAAQRDLLNVTQDVGRLVFWKGYAKGYDPDQPTHGAKFVGFLNRALRRNGRSPFMADGAEQLVADAYAARVAGLPAALAAQDKATARQIDRYYADSLRYYVPPQVRPEISILALQSGAPKTAQALQIRWDERRLAYFGEEAHDGKVQALRTLTPYGGAAELSLDSVEFELTRAMSYANQFLAKLDPTKDFQPLRADTSFNLNSADPFKAWRDVVAKVKPGTQATAELGGFGAPSGYWTAQTWRGWADLLVEHEAEQQALITGEPLSKSDLEWFTVFYAGGWVTESSGNTTGPK